MKKVKYLNEEKKQEQIHSHSYHRYFEGYEENYRVTGDGKLKLQRTYTGRYYKIDVSDKQLIRRRVVYVALFSLAVIASLLASVQRLWCNTMWYVTVASMFSLVFLVLEAISIFQNVTSQREMEIRSYRDSHENLLRYGRITAICEGLTTVCILISIFDYCSEYVPTLLCLLGHLISFAALTGIYLMEKRVHYLELPPKHQHVRLSAVINYESKF